jgi:hypothetical protein
VVGEWLGALPPEAVRNGDAASTLFQERDWMLHNEKPAASADW